MNCVAHAALWSRALDTHRAPHLFPLSHLFPNRPSSALPFPDISCATTRFFLSQTPPPPFSQNISRDGGPRVSKQFSDHCPGLTTMMSRRWVLTCCCYLPSDRENVLNVNTVFCFSESRTCRLATSDKPTLGSIYSSRVFTGVISPMAAGRSGENSSGNGPGCGLGWRAAATSLRKLRNRDRSSEALHVQIAYFSSTAACFWARILAET